MLAARSNKRMGTEKVKKEEVVQRSQLDNKSPIQVPMLIAYNFMDWTRFMLSVGAIVPVLAFMPAGAWLARYISPAVFDRIILILLAAIAARLILQAW